MTDCNHVYSASVKCGRELNHEGVHSHYSDVTASDGGPAFHIMEWNDAGETPEDSDYFQKHQCHYDLGHHERSKIMDQAILHARKSLPKDSVFEVRAPLIPEESSPAHDRHFPHITREQEAADWGIASYMVPKQPKGFEQYETATEPLFVKDIDEGEVIIAGGYILVARIKV